MRIIRSIHLNIYKYIFMDMMSKNVLLLYENTTKYIFMEENVGK